LIPVIGEVQEYNAPLLKVAFNSISQAISRFFDEPFEHVSVLYNGHRRDMFVGETSTTNGRHIRNVRATNIYRANAIQRARLGVELDIPVSIELMLYGRPEYTLLNPESLPAICGPAVLFPDTIVWR
jgi:hypothetical protein